MTSAHDIDLAVCCAVLQRGGFLYLGGIGSHLKRDRLIARLAADGIGDAALARLSCPVGLAQSQSKAPTVSAVSIAPQALAALSSE